MLHRDCFPVLRGAESTRDANVMRVSSSLLYTALAIERTVGIDSEYRPLDYYPTSVTIWRPAEICTRLRHFFEHSFDGLFNNHVRALWKKVKGGDDDDETVKRPSALTFFNEMYTHLLKTLCNCVTASQPFYRQDWEVVVKRAILQYAPSGTIVPRHSDTVVSAIVELIAEMKCATQPIIRNYDTSNCDFEDVARISRLIAHHGNTSVSQYQHILGFMEQLQYPAKHKANVVRAKLDTYIASRAQPYTNLADDTVLLRELFYLSHNKEVRRAVHDARNACDDMEAAERASKIKIPAELKKAYKQRTPMVSVTKCFRRLCTLIMHKCKVLEENVK
jgi:hypothetical protein